MTKSFKDLSSDQIAKFQNRCRQLGIDIADVPAVVTTASARNNIVCGNPSGSSEFPLSKAHTVNTVRELNTLAGGTGGAGDSFSRYPVAAAQLGLPSLDACGGDAARLKNSMTLEQHEAVAQALHAYLLGNPSKVADYEQHINAVHFPMSVATHAAEDLVIDKELIIDNPTGGVTQIVAGTITVKPGGRIVMKTPLSVDAQVFTVEK